MSSCDGGEAGVCERAGGLGARAGAYGRACVRVRVRVRTCE